MGDVRSTIIYCNDFCVPLSAFPLQDHQPGSGSEIQALTLTAFIKKLYTSSDTFPEFADYVHQQEFIEALASTLFPVSRECITE